MDERDGEKGTGIKRGKGGSERGGRGRGRSFIRKTCRCAEEEQKALKTSTVLPLFERPRHEPHDLLQRCV